MEHILCYLKETPRHGILYKKHGIPELSVFQTHTGSKEDRRSASEYCVFFRGNLISWKNKKQSVVSRSSAELEY